MADGLLLCMPCFRNLEGILKNCLQLSDEESALEATLEGNRALTTLQLSAYCDFPGPSAICILPRATVLAPKRQECLFFSFMSFSRS